MERKEGKKNQVLGLDVKAYVPKSIYGIKEELMFLHA